MCYGCGANKVIHTYEDKWSDEEVFTYATQFEFFPEKNLRQRLLFIRDPSWHTYIFSYSIGKDLITAKYGDRPSPIDFTTLLTHPILPSNLV